MASTNSTVDGMGFEEMGQVGSQPYNTWIAGSMTADGGLHTGKGEIYSTSIQNAGPVYAQRIRAGSVITDNNGEGVILFASNGSFSTPNYFITFTANQYSIPGASGLNVGASGTRRASGLEILGPSGTVFDWIAVGI